MIEKNLKFNTLQKAWNYLRDLRKKIKKVKESKVGSKEELGVTGGGKTNAQRLTYLGYCIGLLNSGDYPHYSQKEFHVNLLTAMCKGYSKQYIARASNCTLETFEFHEREAMKRVTDAIERTKKRNIGIVGEESPIVGVRH